MAYRQRTGLTHVEVLTVIGITSLVVAFVLAYRMRSLEVHGSLSCSSHLRQIGLAIKMYANDETRTHAFPRTRYSRADTDHPAVFTKPNASNPFANDGPAVNDVTAALFLVLRTQEITTDVFLCTSDTQAERLLIPNGKDIKSFSNFPSPNNLSYSMHNPYPTEAAEKAGFTWDDNMPADFAIMADKNPGVAELTSVGFSAGGAEQRKVNSLNHRQDGQNMLYADGHVDWSMSPWAGLGQDNVYGYNAQRPFAPSAPTTRPAPANPPPVPIGIVGPPADGNDSVMLPTASP